MFSQPQTANFESIKTLLTIVVSMGPERNGFVIHIGENGVHFYTSLTITGSFWGNLWGSGALAFHIYPAAPCTTLHYTSVEAHFIKCIKSSVYKGIDPSSLWKPLVKVHHRKLRVHVWLAHSLAVGTYRYVICAGSLAPTRRDGYTDG